MITSCTAKLAKTGHIRAVRVLVSIRKTEAPGQSWDFRTQFWTPRSIGAKSTALLSSLMQKNTVISRFLKDTLGGDLLEYALMAGFVAVAAGAVMPGVANSISAIFSQVDSVMSVASTQGNVTSDSRSTNY
jgi:Flp pilus assembly pilin Flp